MTAEEHLLYDVSEGIATITFNRPDAIEKANADDTVKAIIVTGAGERAFCAGADLSRGADKAFLEKRKPNFPSKLSTDMPDIFPHWEEPEFR
jgi:enoyl-CoA hydratase/carnithine racemase